MNKTILKPTKPVILCILDGWGARESTENNAIKLANTPNYDALIADFPNSLLQTSGKAVGLPVGQMGNSEVGHMNIGGGRVVKQELPRIDEAILNDRLKDINCLKKSIVALKKTNGTCHILGLISPGGVHGHQDHIAALAREYSKAGIPVAIHAFTDGRDVPPKSALRFIKKFEDDIAELENVHIVTVSGRYYSMDRDNRWDRVIKAHLAISGGTGHHFESPISAVNHAYQTNLSDEFIEPSIIANYAGMHDGDAIVSSNFRADRAREIMATFVDPSFDGFKKPKNVNLSAAIGMSKYSNHLSSHMECLFPTAALQNTLGEIISEQNLTQLRISETEKYAHVTFFFNGGNEDLYPGEERILIPSPDVATYDTKPEMSALELTNKLVGAILSEKFNLIVVNYANPDMVGHTGVLEAALKAVETIDDCLGKLREALEKVGGAMLVTADHGNIELMKDPSTGVPHTAHTTNLVPFILINDQVRSSDLITLESGALCDIAPTILSLMKLEQPSSMTGRSLIKSKMDGA